MRHREDTPSHGRSFEGHRSAWVSNNTGCLWKKLNITHLAFEKESSLHDLECESADADLLACRRVCNHVELCCLRPRLTGSHTEHGAYSSDNRAVKDEPIFWVAGEFDEEVTVLQIVEPEEDCPLDRGSGCRGHCTRVSMYTS